MVKFLKNTFETKFIILVTINGINYSHSPSPTFKQLNSKQSFLTSHGKNFYTNSLLCITKNRKPWRLSKEEETLCACAWFPSFENHPLLQWSLTQEEDWKTFGETREGLVQSQPNFSCISLIFPFLLEEKASVNWFLYAKILTDREMGGEEAG